VDPEAWISKNALILDLKFPIVKYNKTPSTLAIQELFSVGEVTAKKTISAIIIVTVELA
jgi:hypothetical protein